MEVIKKHSIKIAIWTIITSILAVVAFGVRAGIFISDVTTNTTSINTNATAIETMADKILKMNETVIETSVNVKRLVQEQQKN